MADDIPFDKTLRSCARQVDEVLPGVRRRAVQQSEPVHLQGHGELHHRPRPRRHRRSRPATMRPMSRRCSMRCAARPSRISSSPTPIATIRRRCRAIKAATGATVLAEGPHRAARPLHVGEAPRLDATTTPISAPTALADGEVVAGDGWAVEAVATPGHTANHMAFALRERNVLFSGDHVMAWSTPVVAPPDGSMGDYMASLEKLARRSETDLFPGPRRGGPRRAALRQPPTSCTARRARPRS